MTLKLVATLLALPLLAACAPEVESTIYLADVQKVLADHVAVATPALLRVPQSDEDACKTGLDALIEKLKAIAPVSGKGQCISKDSDELAEVETSIQIVAPDTKIDDANLFALVASPADNGDGSIGLSFRMLKPIADVIKALASDDSMSTDFDPTHFVIHINNDTAGSAELSPVEVFLDGKPHMPGDPPVTLARRDAAEIKFSDVASSFTELGNTYAFASLSLK